MKTSLLSGSWDLPKNISYAENLGKINNIFKNIMDFYIYYYFLKTKLLRMPWKNIEVYRV